MEYDSAINRNDLYAWTMWMNLNCIALSDRHQTPKVMYYMILFTWPAGKRQNYRDQTPPPKKNKKNKSVADYKAAQGTFVGW